MPDYSSGLLLTWHLAALEATSAKYEFVEREHLMVGLAKVEEAVEGMDLNRLPANGGGPEALKAEVEAVGKSFRDNSVDPVKLRRKLRQMMGKGDAKEQNPETVGRSVSCREAFELAVDYAPLSAPRIGCMHLLAALLTKPGMRVGQAVTHAGGDVQVLQQAVLKVVGKPLVNVAAQPPAVSGKMLVKYGTDLTQLAADGKIEPLIGRRDEMLKLIRTLSRKTKNNPLLLGDPGVGKTALVRALALRIAQKKTPPSLLDKRIVELNLGSLVAGTHYRGEFEERMSRLVDEAKSRQDVILFIDEIHTLIHAGAAEGGLDAANLLKPALAGAEFHCIGSTTLAEYRKYFEKDAALARRFQPLMVEEPSPGETLKILLGLREHYEKHHGVRILPVALKAAVELSCRYLPERRLPDKALDLVDEACARIKIGSASLSFRADEPVEIPDLMVTADTVAQVVAERTGIPVARLSAEGQLKLKGLAATLGKRVIGQPDAVEKVTRVVTMSRAGLRDPNKPIGVFLFVGPTGVGKTELCKALADALFGSEQDIIRIDMSEYKEKHSISRLIGAPPGFIGHDEEGQLTGRLRRKPYSVVLLDEIEKAHPEVCDLFLPLFDEGKLTDAHGRAVDGKNAIYVMTSNMAIASGGGHIGFLQEEAAVPASAVDDDREAIHHELNRAFRPEFLNRIDEVVLFQKLGAESIQRIAAQMLQRVKKSLEAQEIAIEFAESALVFIGKAGYDPRNGARPLARAIDRLINGPLSEKLVAGEIHGGDRIDVEASGGAIHFQVTAGEGDHASTQ